MRVVTHKGFEFDLEVIEAPVGQHDEHHAQFFAFDPTGDLGAIGEVSAYCAPYATGITNMPSSCYAGSDVDSRFRNRGIATRLYEEAARWSCDHGFSFGSDTCLSIYSKGFWKKQLRKRRARRLVSVMVSGEGKKLRFTRYILPCPPPASLAQAQRTRWRGWR